jgi:hypothetical protein
MRQRDVNKATQTAYHGDALDDMPDEYVEYRAEHGSSYMDEECANCISYTLDTPARELDGRRMGLCNCLIKSADSFPDTMSRSNVPSDFNCGTHFAPRPSFRGFHLNRCPDCDATLEQRSMPEGIEEWCPVCNMMYNI